MRIRVSWDGPDPEPGEWLAARRADCVYRIEAGNRLVARSASVSRFDLILARFDVDRRPAETVLHPWSRAHAAEPGAPERVRLARSMSPDGREDETAPGGPTAVMATRWTDPDDIRPNASARPRQITGWRTFCPLRRMKGMAGSQITALHIIAADMLRERYDSATIGMSSERDGEARHEGYGPVLGPSLASVHQAESSDALREALAIFTVPQTAMISAIVLRNNSLSGWCEGIRERTGYPVEPKVEMGRLLSVLDLLTKFYGLAAGADVGDP